MRKENFIDRFNMIEDTRQPNKVHHKLVDIIFIVIAATVANCNSWEEIHLFAKRHEEWLRKYIELPYGIPVPITFQRIFRWIDPKQFESVFTIWMQDVSVLTKGTIVSIDGKTMRGSADASTGRNAIHIVNAWADTNQLILSQIKTEDKSNEITAIPELIKIMNVENCIITTDAMGCQTKIAETIIDKKADYVLAVKGNQPSLHQDIKLFFDDAQKSGFENISYEMHKTSEKGHGRIDINQYFLVNDVGWLENIEKWAGLGAIGMAIRESTKIVQNTKSVEIRYFIMSFDKGVSDFARAVRKHWGVESSHWMLDVVMKEDSSKIRKDNEPQNFAVLKRIALNLIRSEKTQKGTGPSKRYKCSIDIDYLDKVLFG